jgi:hypothetical protein
LSKIDLNSEDLPLTETHGNILDYIFGAQKKIFPQCPALHSATNLSKINQFSKAHKISIAIDYFGG